ncbi:MAG: translocation/assembly module TamB domain-containing protein [Hydrogenophaga sp.]|uniref:translocation/assembly module TamB domain-containing protein n=1 Tax=Hydrogenophaga sp. TaxID=1904254 RepID=UPI0025801732|nr:translocation/assembly module TamB domain-containing protein [Hydrogenophaga sp.]MBL0944166.1 translocation/assembly module TamB domain-containing protein [Hydrogenophaga sp.]
METPPPHPVHPPEAGDPKGPARPLPWGLTMLGRALLWLPAVLLGVVLAGALALGLWASTDGSLAQALRWGLAWQADHAPGLGHIEAEGVEGSVFGGGSVGRLRWQQEGLRVSADGARVSLGGRFWLGLLRGEARIAQLRAERVQVIDERPPRPAEPATPLQNLVLPLPVEVSATVGVLALPGAELQAIDLTYRYGRADPGLGATDAHTLTLRSLQWAEGRYQAQATLGAQSPMPLRLQARGDLATTVPEGGTLDLRARATAQGTLAGADAALALTAQIEPVRSTDATPTLAGTARVRPWASQPLDEADLRLHRLNLAMLWPQAPQTALTGTLRALPEGAQWRASAQLQNEQAGAIDRRRLPLQSLELALVQQGERWTLERLDARAAGGRLQAEGQRDGVAAAGATAAPGAPPSASPLAALGDWQARLRLNGIDPAQLWSTLAPAALDGELRARALGPRSERPGVEVDARIAPAGRQPRRSAAEAWRLRELVLQGRWQPTGAALSAGELTLQRARLDALDGRIDAQGRVDTARPQANGRLALDLPGLQARFEGTLAHADGQGALDLDMADGARLLAWLRGLQNAPLIGDALRTALAPWADASLDARASGRLRWQGGLGGIPALGWPGAGRASPPRIDLQLQVDRLRAQRGGDAPIDLALGDSRLTLQGPPEALALGLRARAERAPWRAELDTAGQLALGSSPLDGRQGALRLDRLALSATPGDAGVRWTLSPTAPLRARWRAHDKGLDAELDAAGLRVLPQRGASAAAAPITLSWDSLSWRAGALQTRGRLEGLPLAWADALASTEANGQGPLAAAGLGGDLLFDGRWDLLLPAQAGEPPRVSLALERRSGDLLVQTDGAAFEDAASRSQRVPAGVKTAQLSVNTEGARVNAQLRWDSERLGEASAEASTTLSPPDAGQGAWHWPESAPLSGRVRANLPQVGVWSVLAPPGWRVRGALRAEATVGGTRAAPQFSGSLQGDDLALRSNVDGITFRNGQLRATLAGERIVIERLRLEGRGGAERGGVLEASGSAEWRRVQRDGATVREPVIALQLSADKLRASTRPDRRLTVSGQLDARLEGAALRLRGRLRADEALIVLPDETAPTLGGDVVVRGTEYPIERGSGVRVVPDVQVTLDLGDAFQLRGHGLQTRLAGQLEVRSAPNDPAPRIVGEVRTVSGTYRAYGQQLAIETGVVRFNGPYDNPALEILAVRPNATTQRVGVQITGSAQTPRVRLFSDPELPDSEKLAWLVLGRPASGAGAEAAVLQQAAIALLSRNGNSPLDGGLASALGLDALSFSGSSTNADGSSTAAALTLGKRIADNLYLSYERSLAGTLNTVSIFYDVTRRFTVRARAGSENAIDLIFTLSRD